MTDTQIVKAYLLGNESMIEITCFSLFRKSCHFKVILESEQTTFIYKVNKIFTDEKLVEEILSSRITQYLSETVLNETENEKEITYVWNENGQKEILSRLENEKGEVDIDKFHEIVLLTDCLDLKPQMIALLDYYGKKFGQHNIPKFIADIRPHRYKITEIFAK